MKMWTSRGGFEVVDVCGQREEGSEMAKILWTSFMDGPLLILCTYPVFLVPTLTEAMPLGSIKRSSFLLMSKIRVSQPHLFLDGHWPHVRPFNILASQFRAKLLIE